MDEFSLIRKIKQNHYQQSSLVKGIGDDAAVLRETNNDLVVTVDTFVEGVHFTTETMDAFHIGYRGLAANFSDMAAMGATPLYYLVSIVVPRGWEEDSISDIFIGMRQLAVQHDTDLIGGDTVSGKELVLSITVIGKVEKNAARYRSDAKTGDIVFVTGTLGDASAGLHLLQQKINMNDKDYFINRHRAPVPRIEIARGLTHLKRVALNDVSDGIASEAHEIAEASQVSIILKDKNIPVHPSFTQFSPDLQTKWKYFGGEDFELLGTVSQIDWPNVQKTAKALNLKISEIGYVTHKEMDYVYLKKDGVLKPLTKAGYTHLK
ncbi:thiamine-phosphate kinase [Ralstonia pickettii]|nr:thiamine-phosphate kinase [Ralstonia pickettii]